MRQLSWGRAALVLLPLVACTPLGLWIYEDPVVTVHRVTFELQEPRPMGRSPVHVAIAVENRNDFPLEAERVELTLRMDSVHIGRLDHASAASFPTDTTSTVTMPLSLEKRTTRKQLEALGAGTHVFAVRGRATFRTPIGLREVRFAQEGAMVFGQRPDTPSP